VKTEGSRLRCRSPKAAADEELATAGAEAGGGTGGAPLGTAALVVPPLALLIAPTLFVKS